ncbi:DNA recombination protein RmuC [Sphingomonas vulcanisoli]|uniref:DNA recombination protein RmuC homolog n=1 Tax=Sphingomonas vulcanisoli TaxID=1658060 RepID=A0ABX0TP13_9SPHN|nr:DNA recombination protein RmuC [Sphingomonas vulcanisoli]NIJ07273.1 DNA recombination protein RmuC [Sphingomonas vulcanisoli]
MAASMLWVIAGLALLIGLALGWLAAGVRAAAEQARLAERVSAGDLVRMQLDEVTRERNAATAALAAERATGAAQIAAFERQLANIREAKEALSAQFSEVGAKLLADAQRQFLERADQRFTQAGENNEAKLKALLTPVEATLKQYDAKLGEIEKARIGSYAELKEAVGQLSLGNEVVRKETARLTNVLRSSPKHRGRWGEEQLRTILESAGLAENVDFELQASVSANDAGVERQLRPDCVIKLPGNRCIVVDVKCPLVAFEQAYDEEDETLRAGFLLQHANAMRAYANDLGRKAYWRQFDLSPDFVILFVPGEHFLSAAAERAPDLIEQAFRQGVIIASTINMLALAKVMAGMWRQEGLAQRAEEIGKLGKELYARLQTMGRHVERLGRNLTQATGAYNDFVGSLESQVLTSAKRFEALKVDTGGKTIEPLPIADIAVRPLAKLAGTANEDVPEAAE